MLDLAGRRDALLADVEALTRFEADYRDRMVRALEADLSALRSRPPASPGPRPETSDVDLPVLAEGFVRREQTPTPTPEARPADPPVSTPPAPAPFVPSATSFASLIPPTSPTPAGATDAAQSERSSSLEGATEAVDVQSLFDHAGVSDALAFEQPVAATSLPKTDPFAPKPAPPTTPAVGTSTANASTGSTTAISGNVHSGDAIDAEVLDDDAFFATLREAVHDDTPLGPRDEADATGENMFFDQEAESSGFRDVFRRRR